MSTMDQWTGCRQPGEAGAPLTLCLLGPREPASPAECVYLKATAAQAWKPQLLSTVQLMLPVVTIIALS